MGLGKPRSLVGGSTGFGESPVFFIKLLQSAGARKEFLEIAPFGIFCIASLTLELFAESVGSR